MDTPTATRPPATAQPQNAPSIPRPEIELPDKHLAELLLWASLHEDTTVTAQAEQIRTAVNALTDRRKRDAELERITTEAEQLEQRLAELRTREAELRPAPTAKARGRAHRDYDPVEVRAWARAHGHAVPDRGQIPKAIMTAWRAR